MDLTLFQFDYDLTFAAFFMNADKTIYGRYGSRSDDKEAEKEISVEGFRAALTGGLELHRNYPANKATLTGKQPRPIQFRRPEDFPSLAGKYQSAISYTGKVAQSCMHCHQVRDAERMWYRAAKKPIPDEVLYPWPMPDIVGLRFDPERKAMLKEVIADSPASRAGFKARDELISLEGQPLLSTADVQWILHGAPSPAALRAEILRSGKRMPLTLNLPKDWRLKSDISWRPTTWELRRMGTGGLVLGDLNDRERAKRRLPETAMALLVEYVGQYNEHAAGKRAGFQKDDIILDVDSQSTRMTESELFRYLLQNKMKGERVRANVLRDGTKHSLELPMQ
jgi:serine protease Do